MIGTLLPVRCVAAIAVALASSFGASGDANAKTIDVVIEHFAFTPASIEVEAGDTVVFTNRDIAPHTATAADGSWTTMDIASGRSEAIVVRTNGAAAYFCKYHPLMKGRFIIKAP
jgi:plastocyanin